MTVDISKIKVDDEVTVRATVTHVEDSDGDITVNFVSSGVPAHSLHSEAMRPAARAIGAGAIATHTPRPLVVGDRVLQHNKPEAGAGEIKAICNGSAWVLWFEDGSPTTRPIYNLERVDE